MYELPLTSGVWIPYTRYCEVARAISKFCFKQPGKVKLPGKAVTQNLMKGNGKHGYTI
jgi:hypothetical protein